MLPYYFIYIAVFIRLLGGVSYLRATLDGRARPNPLSWFFWGTTPIIAFFAEISAGVGLPALATLALGISPLAVFVAVMYKNPRLFQLDAFNLLCGILAILGIILWRATENPDTAIMLAIIADIASVLPTLRKIWRFPNSEHSPTYLMSASSMTLVLFTIQQWNFATFAFPVYVLCINLFILWFIGQAKLLRVTKKHETRRKPTTIRRAAEPA